MSIFVCEKCGAVENTATSNYWEQKYPYNGGAEQPKLCSECDMEIGKWHGRFEKRPAKGLLLGSDGFLYSDEDVVEGKLTRMGVSVVRRIGEEGK